LRLALVVEDGIGEPTVTLHPADHLHLVEQEVEVLVKLGIMKYEDSVFASLIHRLLTAAFTSSSVNSLEGPLAAEVAGWDADWSLATKNSRAFWIFPSGFWRKASFDFSVEKQ